MFPGLDLYCAHPAQPLTTAGEEIEHLDHDVRGVICSICWLVELVGYLVD